jgi:hypothetical protein
LTGIGDGGGESQGEGGDGEELMHDENSGLQFALGGSGEVCSLPMTDIWAMTVHGKTGRR